MLNHYFRIFFFFFFEKKCVSNIALESLLISLHVILAPLVPLDQIHLKFTITTASTKNPAVISTSNPSSLPHVLALAIHNYHRRRHLHTINWSVTGIISLLSTPPMSATSTTTITITFLKIHHHFIVNTLSSPYYPLQHPHCKSTIDYNHSSSHTTLLHHLGTIQIVTITNSNPRDTTTPTITCTSIHNYHICHC